MKGFFILQVQVVKTTQYITCNIMCLRQKGQTLTLTPMLQAIQFAKNIATKSPYPKQIKQLMVCTPSFIMTNSIVQFASTS
jgi:hypothetical protein